jgi:hypothetical protein
MPKSRSLALCVCFIASACDPVDPAEGHDEEETVLAEPSDAELPLVGATADTPCGEHTIEVVRHESGSTLTFCVLDEDGVVAIGESRPMGTPSLLEEIGYHESAMCPADVLRWVAPDEDVPEELEVACDPTELRVNASLDADGSVETREVGMLDELASEIDPAAVDYCANNGASLFDTNRCTSLRTWYWADPLDRSMWCITDLWGWHDRSLYGTRGDEGNYGGDTIAVCSGSVRFRAWWRWDVGDAWIGSLDSNYGTGALTSWAISYTGGLEDIDIRFRVESTGTGVHRHAGSFEDD